MNDKMNIIELLRHSEKITINVDSTKDLFDEYNKRLIESGAMIENWKDGNITVKVLAYGKEIISVVNINDEDPIEDTIDDLINVLLYSLLTLISKGDFK